MKVSPVKEKRETVIGIREPLPPPIQSRNKKPQKKKEVINLKKKGGNLHKQPQKEGGNKPQKKGGNLCLR